ncbi:MAG TPA: histidine phosphatase family protein [Candidatus Paceibacterota bacterium]|nr:histidine phosphatase family protein [Candidatus Paceibacterota bacterium]
MEDIGLKSGDYEKAKDYSLSITLTRHGAKKSIDGGLSEQGREEAGQYFTEAYEGIPLDQAIEREVISSSKERAVETATQYQGALDKAYGTQAVVHTVDDRLSESDFVKFASNLPEEEKGDVIKLWLESPRGKENLHNFVEWLLEKIVFQKEEGGKKEIDAFSHGPLMAIFIIEIEKRLGVNILTIKHGQDNYSIKNLAGYGSKLGFLKNINITMSSERPNEFKLVYNGQSYQIPVKILKDIIKDT